MGKHRETDKKVKSILKKEENRCYRTKKNHMKNSSADLTENMTGEKI